MGTSGLEPLVFATKSARQLGRTLSDSLSSRLSDSQWRAAEAQLMQFDLAWQSGAAELSEYAPRSFGTESSRYLLVELIKIDLEYQWARGSRKCIEDYLLEHRGLTLSERLLFELASAEMLVRQSHDEPIDEKTLRDRFPDIAERLIAAMDQERRQNLPVQSAKASAGDTERVPIKISRYEIDQELGRGAFAVVYRGWDPQLQRYVAIKVPRREMTGMREVRARMMREAQSVASLKHPVIMPVYEVNEDDDQVFIVSELIEGQTLEQLLRAGPVEADQAAEWVATLADGLHYAHQCGIVHRDIKPANIMIRSNGQPVLMDFGLAFQSNAAATLTQHGDLLGTPAFMSPEQARGEVRKVDGISDVYSLGVVLYQLISGELPFTGSPASVLHRVINDDPPKPNVINHRAPRDLSIICWKAIAKERDRRYASASDFADDLRRYVRRTPISARPSSPLELMWLWCRRQPAVATTIGLALATILLITSFAFLRVANERDRFREQRDLAESNLYRALVKDASSITKARGPNWRALALQSVEKASKIATTDSQRLDLRDLAVEIMSRDSYDFQLANEWRVGGHAIDQLEAIPGSPLLVAASGESLLFLSSESGQCVHRVELGATLSVLEVAPSGDFLLAVDVRQRLLRCPIAEDWKIEEVAWDFGNITSIAFSPDSHRVAFGTFAGPIHVADTADQELEPIFELHGHRGAVWDLSWGRRSPLFGSAGEDGKIVLWNLLTRQQIREWEQYDPVRQIEFDIHDTALAAIDRETWGSFRTHPLLAKLPATHPVHAHRIKRIRNSSLGWVTCSMDGTIRVSKGPQTTVTERHTAVVDFALLPETDGLQIVAAYSDGILRKWTLERSQLGTTFATLQRGQFIGSNTLAVDTHMYERRDRHWEAVPWNVANFTSIAAISDDRFLCGTKTGSLQVFDHQLDSPIHTIPAHQQAITAITVDNLRQVLFAASEDGSISKWDGKTFESLGHWEAAIGPIHSLDYDPATQLLAAAGELGARLWSTRSTEQLVWQLPHYSPRSVIALNGQHFAVSSIQGHVSVFELPTNVDPTNALDVEVVHELRPEDPIVRAMKIKDGQLVIVGQHSFDLWDLNVGHVLRHVDAGFQSGLNLDVHPTEDLVVHNSRFWRTSDDHVSATLHFLGYNIGAFSPNGKEYFFANSRGFVGSISVQRILSPHRSRYHQPFDAVSEQGLHADSTWGLATSPDGHWVATIGHDRRLKIWDVKSRSLKHTKTEHTYPGWSVAFSPDSERLASGAECDADNRVRGEIRVWDVGTGQLICRREAHSDLVRGLAYDPSGQWLVSAASDGSIHVWDADSMSELFTLHQGEHAVYDISFSSNGELLAAACSEDRVRVWETAGWRNESVDHRDPIAILDVRAWSVAFSADDQLLATGSSQGSVALWNPENWSRIVTIPIGESNVRSLSFSEDGAFLSTASYGGKNFIWDLRAIRDGLRKLTLDW